jgi:hypothetical protein
LDMSSTLGVGYYCTYREIDYKTF